MREAHATMSSGEYDWKKPVHRRLGRSCQLQMRNMQSPSNLLVIEKK